MLKRFEIITRKSASFRIPKDAKWWQQLFIKTWEGDHYWTCVFTPWRLFATFFVKRSKYYKARVEPW